MPHFLHLDVDVMTHILQFLHFTFVLRVAAVCRRLRSFLSGPGVHLTADLSSCDHGHSEAHRNAYSRTEEDGYVGGEFPTDSLVLSIPVWALGNLRVLNLNGGFLLTDDSLQHVSTHCPQLQELYVNFARSLTDTGLRSVARHTPGLRALGIDECDRVTDVGVSSIAAQGNLTYLNINEVTRITDNTLRMLADCCRGLRNLAMHKCHRITDRGVAAIARCCPELEEINLNSCTQITGAALAALTEAGLALRSLQLSKCCRVEQAALVSTLRAFPELRKLSLNWLPAAGTQVLDAVAATLSRLTKLGINRCGTEDPQAVCAVLRNSPQLQQFSASCCGELVSDEVLGSITNDSRHLEYLNVSGCPVSEAALAALTAGLGSRLKALHLGRAPAVTDASLAAIAACPNLREFYLSNNNAVTDAGMAGMLQSTHELVVLSVVNCQFLTGATLAAVAAHAAGLHKLLLDQCQGMSGDGLASLHPPLSRLEAVSLLHMRLTAADVAAFLRQHPRLRSVQVESSVRSTARLAGLGAGASVSEPSGCAVIDELQRNGRILSLRLNAPHYSWVNAHAVQLVRRLPNLTSLTLRRQVLSGDFISYCAREMRHLTYLDVSGAHQVDLGLAHTMLEALGVGNHLRVAKSY